MTRPPPRSTLFPYTTLFRSVLLDSVTIAPPVGAAEVNVAVPVLAAPPTTLVGLTVTEDKRGRDRKSTRLNSSHGYISYAVFCLKKKKQQHTHINTLHYLRTQ